MTTTRPSLRDALLQTFFQRRWRGFETLHRLSGRRRIVATNRYGASFELDPHDYVDSVVLREGFYESEVFDQLRTEFRPGAVFWDVGACFGLHAVTAATRHAGVVVHAFEPNPASANRVARNSALNGATVHRHPFALSDSDGDTTLFLPEPGNSGMATIRPFAPELFFPAGRVPTRRADSLIDAGEVPAPAVLKLDVEGSEAAVLDGFGTHLADPALRLIVLECGPAVLDPASREPLRTRLLDTGFQLQSLTRNEATAHNLINVAAIRPR